MDPLRSSAALSTEVLDTPAAASPPALSRAALGEEDGTRERVLPGGTATRASRGTTPRAHKTGVGAARPDRAAKEAKERADWTMSMVQKGQQALADSVRRLADSKPGKETTFDKALGTALAEMAKKEALTAAEALPFAKVISKAITLSAVFAEAAGEAMAAANAKLSYDEATRAALAGGEVTEESLRALQFVRGWQKNNVMELEGVLRAGLYAVAEKAVDELFGAVGDTFSKSVKDVADQLAKQVFKRNEVFAILNDVLTDQAKLIPETRRRVERITFHTLASSWVKQFTTQETQGRLAPVLGGIGGKEPVHVGVLAGLLEVIFRGTYKEYADRVPVAAATAEVRASLMGAAHDLLRQARENGVTVEEGPEVTVAPDRVTAPPALLRELESPRELGEVLRMLRQRKDEFDAAVKRMQALHEATRRRFQEEIYRAQDLWERNPRAPDPLALHTRRTKDLERLRGRSVAELRQFIRMVEAEFGTKYDGGRTSTRVRFVGTNDEEQYLRSFFSLTLQPWRP